MSCGTHLPAGIGVPAIAISLHIVNTYQFYPSVEVCVTDEIIAGSPIDHLPQTDDERQAFDEWAYEHIYQFTGVGHTDGDSWYDVTVTACSAAWLVGHTFEWGY
jgi:hypothetical protein